MTISLQALRDKRDQLVASLTRVDDLRPGFLTARFRKCGKPNCHCAEKDSPGHGPSFSLTHRVAGRTVTQVIPQGPAVERAKAQIAEYHRFRKLVRELIVVSEQICSAQVRDSEALPASEAKKKPLRPSIRQRRRSGDWRQAVEDLDLERTAEALGKEIAEDERHCTEPCDVLALPRTLYRGMDGTGIPLHAEELVGRTGKQPDGSAKTGEVKLCTIWGAESLDEQGTPIRD